MLAIQQIQLQKQRDRIEDGFAFERGIQQILEMTRHQVLSETDIRRQFGKDITAIDHLLITDNFYIAFQDKWRQTKVPNCDINHFIQCVNTIEDTIGIICLGIYLSKKSLTSISQIAFDRQNKKQQMFNKFISIHSESLSTIYDILMKTLYSYNIYYYDDDGALQMIE